MAQNSKLGDLAEGFHTYITGLVAMLMDVDLLLCIVSILNSICQVPNDYRGTGDRGGEGPI